MERRGRGRFPNDFEVHFSVPCAKRVHGMAVLFGTVGLHFASFNVSGLLFSLFVISIPYLASMFSVETRNLSCNVFLSTYALFVDLDGI